MFFAIFLTLLYYITFTNFRLFVSAKVSNLSLLKYLENAMRLMQPFHTLTNQIFDYVNLPHGLTHTTDLNQTDNKLDALITPSGG